MFKWFRKQLLKGIVKDLLKELPEYYSQLKGNALLFLEGHTDEILEKVKSAIKQAVLDFVKEKL